MARPHKEAAVQEIKERFEAAEAALLTEYRGLTVAEIAELRGALREADAEYKVLKNTLARIAVREVGLADLAEMLVGPTAVAFVKGDAVAAAKALDDAAKRFPVLVVKGGVISGQVIDAEGAKALAGLEPREVQLAKIAMLANTPLQQTVNVFAALLRDLGSMLTQVLSAKESGALPAGDADAGPGQDEGSGEAGPAEAEAAVAETVAETPAEGDEVAEEAAVSETGPEPE